jgi:formate-dependent nitrite reductase membrane component NrfD
VSDAFFTAPPHWRWLVILYFFFGGLAGGSYVIAAMVDFFGDELDRPLARLGYYVAFPSILVGGALLIIDLTRPDRFWHMLVMSQRGWPIFKYWSPMSVGSWGVALFGAFAFLSFVGALGESGRPGLASLVVLRRGVLGEVITVLGGLFGFFLAGYTGVLLAVTNRPIWSDTPLLGLLFLVSAASISAAALILLGLRRGIPAYSLSWLERIDGWLMLLELLVLIAFVVSLGPVARVWLRGWGALLVVGVVFVGILLPLALRWRPWLPGRLTAPIAALLVLVGGFILRVVIVLSSESA